MSKARNLSDFISDATIDSTEIADLSVTHAKLHTDMNLSGKTLTFATNQISGNSIDGGVISNFASTGIDDNSSSTAVTILSSGNVGIGTASPARQLSIVDDGTNGQAMMEVLDSTNNNLSGIFLGRANNTNIGGMRYFHATNYLALRSNDADALIINSSGNVGIGESPSSTIRNDGASAEKALQIGTRAMFFSDGGVTTDLQNNSHLNNADTRVAMATDSGSLYQQYQGAHKWFNAASVSAGATQSMTERMRIDSSGNVIQGNNGSHSWTANNNTLFAAGGIGITANSDWSLQLAGSTTERIRFFTSSGGSSTVGNISVSTAGTTYSTTSDRRLKDNIQPIADATDKLINMNPVTHTWIADPEAPKVHGFIAQEMQEVVPEAVSGDAESDEIMSMDYGRITPVIVAALQDALKEIKELKTRIDELESK